VGRKTLALEDSGGVRQMESETVESRAVRQWYREAVRQFGSDNWQWDGGAVSQ
jgi:hypothetical protein